LDADSSNVAGLAVDQAHVRHGRGERDSRISTDGALKVF
jgi:hypothetical protein